MVEHHLIVKMCELFAIEGDLTMNMMFVFCII